MSRTTRVPVMNSFSTWFIWLLQGLLCIARAAGGAAETTVKMP